MKNVVVLTGAGISAESGLGTFRDSGGLWNKYSIEDVATPYAFENNPALVLEFYNIRRRQLLNAQPNDAHFELNKIKKKFNLFVITQNIDDLHERSGTENTLHLHGKLIESRSTIDNRIYPINGSELNIGDYCNRGGQLRPNVVWFGEDVPNMSLAIKQVSKAFIFVIIGTSLNVYPAASLVNYAKKAKRIILIDKNPPLLSDIEVIREKASIAVPLLVSDLLKMSF
ncbi:MAG: NAD-dependent protein deacylase [Flavobacteriales bacterium]|nr:NAD-dependent protein deacylase [Flavobacteriales bacterium]